MVKNWCNVLSMEGVTVCGHHPECRVTFGRGGLCTKFVQKLSQTCRTLTCHGSRDSKRYDHRTRILVSIRLS